MPSLEFSKATFWVQIHNVPERSLTQATMIRKVIEVADQRMTVLVMNSFE